MTLKLYERVVLTHDVPDAHLNTGDVAVLIDFIAHPDGGEEGAVLEVFNALGESIDVITVPVSTIAAITADHIPSVRSRAS